MISRNLNSAAAALHSREKIIQCHNSVARIPFRLKVGHEGGDDPKGKRRNIQALGVRGGGLVDRAADSGPCDPSSIPLGEKK